MPTTQKERKGQKERKSQKKCQKGIRSRMVPKVVQNKAFGEGTRRAVNEVTLVWSQKLIQKDAFDLQRLMRNPGEFSEFCFSVAVVFLTDFGRMIDFAV